MATRNRKRTWIAVSILLIFAVLVRVNVRQGRVAGPSMEPTYHDGETVLVWKTAPRSKLKPGDVVVIRDKNGEELIKRIAFIRPKWSPDPPFRVFFKNRTNGVLVPYGYLFGYYFIDVREGRKPVPPPGNTIYVMGDNWEVSDDSRDFGPVSPKQILGKVIP